MAACIVSGERKIATELMFERAIRAAKGFKSLSVGERDTVAVLLRNELSFFEATWGAAQIGAFTFPANWHLTGREFAYILEDCGAKVIVAHADLLRNVQADIPADIAVLVVDTPEEIAAAYRVPPAARMASGTQWDDWLNSFDATPLPPTAAPGAVFYTSGTTGKAKGVRRATATPAESAGMVAGACFSRSA